MGRPVNDDLIRSWKVCLPATLAGATEHLLWDRIHNKPLYGAKAKLLTLLLERWHDHIAGRPPLPLPSIEDIRNA